MAAFQNGQQPGDTNTTKTDLCSVLGHSTAPELSLNGNTEKDNMEYNRNKYYVEGSGVLSEAEKLQVARDLRTLELEGVLEYREGTWGLTAGIEIEETAEGTGTMVRIHKQNGGVPARSAESSTQSSGEQSETRGPSLSKAARPSAEDSSSPDTNHHKRVLRERRRPR
jgi:hypothetical protein